MIKIKHRIISAGLSLLCALMVGGAFPVHAQEPPLIHLSDEDKFDIVESVLLGEFMVPREEFRGLTLSSANLEFFNPAQISRLGFLFGSPGSISNSFGTVEYLVFRKIEASGNNVMVTLASVVEDHPCFGPTVSREQTFFYQYHIDSGRWTGELVRKTPRQLSDSTRWSRAIGTSDRPRLPKKRPQTLTENAR